MTKTVEQKVLKFIDENHLISKGDKILIALSGGADSVFLISFLLKYKKKFNTDLSAFHLNHKLRGKESEADEKFCKNFCSENKIKFIVSVKDVKSYAKKNKLSVEEAGRELRYNELNKAVKKNHLTKIGTAHNASDNIETILLNFFKGTGLKGLTGIPVRRENIIRPILCLSSEEIREYLKVNKINFRIDESNLNLDYERNFLRNEIIPKLKQRLNPLLEEKISTTANIFKEINLFVEKKLSEYENKTIAFSSNELTVNLKRLSGLDKNLWSHFLKSMIEQKFGIELSSVNIKSLVDLISSQPGAELTLKQNVIASRLREVLLVKKASKNRLKKYNHTIKVGQKLKLDGTMIAVEQVKGKNIKLGQDKLVEFISGDDTGNKFTIRNWKNGDRFQPIGMKGTKKISDFLSDVKVSSSRKKEQLVLTNSGRIVWVIGLRVDERFKINHDTKNIFRLTVSHS